MKKELPKIKKSLKSFILEEDAKVMDKTTTKIALYSTFFSLAFISNADDVNAKGHGNHNNHKNDLGNEDYLESDTEELYSEVKHANHYNHKNGSGGGYC